MDGRESREERGLCFEAEDVGEATSVEDEARDVRDALSVEADRRDMPEGASNIRASAV
jgi:hypothetical protein